MESTEELLDLFIIVSLLFLYPTVALEFSGSPISAPPPQPNSGIPPTSVSRPPVPALFVIGDSTADCGTNNFLLTLARADRLPYGRDFDTHQPTGRFSNGRIPVDYLGNLGLRLIDFEIGLLATIFFFLTFFELD